MCEVQKLEGLAEVDGPAVQVRQVVAVQPQKLQVPLTWTIWTVDQCVAVAELCYGRLRLRALKSRSRIQLRISALAAKNNKIRNDIIRLPKGKYK